MNSVLIEHVKVSELPEAWRDKLPTTSDTHVTVRIEAESDRYTESAEVATSDDLLFGMWRDRKDMADVSAYIRKLRTSRF